MRNLGPRFFGEVSKIDQLRSAKLWKGVKPDVPEAFAQLVRELTPNTPKAQRGPLTRLIDAQLHDLSKQKEWPTFDIVSGTVDGQRWVGPKMNTVQGAENFWGTLPGGSDNLHNLSAGLDYLGIGTIEELLSLPALRNWTLPQGFSGLPVYQQRRILERAIRENTTN